MCGRYSLDLGNEEHDRFSRHFGIAPDWWPTKRYNIAPGQDCAVVRAGKRTRELTAMRWGFRPSTRTRTSSDFKIINARAETIDSRPVFRAAFQSRRCIVPATGFYEWKKEAGERKKTPHHIRQKKARFIGLGAISDRSGGELENCDSFAIITTAASGLMAEVHDRMPLIIDPLDYESWLDDRCPRSFLLDMIRSAPNKEAEILPLSDHVSSTAREGPLCLAPREDSRQGELRLGVS